MMTSKSHLKARELFDSTVESYQERVETSVYNLSSLIFRRRIDIVERLLDRVPSRGRVLDFGMGPAVFGEVCAHRRLSYLGIDISPKMVEQARALNLENADFMVGDIDTLVDFRQSIDAVLAIGLLDYLDDPEEGMRLLAECVKPGGHLILSFRNRRSVPRLLRDSIKRVWQMVPARAARPSEKAFFSDVHEHAFDVASELRPMLVEMGFENFEVDYFNCSLFFFNFRLPPGLWKTWYRWDARLASARTRLMCSGGVLAAERVKPIG